MAVLDRCDLDAFPLQELFKKVVPYHCLGCIWSQRDKKGKEHLAPTIRATVSQFNSVTNCVIATCLGDRTLKPQQRAKVVERWIEVARVGWLLVVSPSLCFPWSVCLCACFKMAPWWVRHCAESPRNGRLTCNLLEQMELVRPLYLEPLQ